MRHCACATCQQLDQLTMHPSCVCVCVAQTMPSLPMRMVLPALQTSLSLGFAYLYCFRALQSSSKYIDKPYTRQAVAYLYCLHLLGFLRVSHQCLAQLWGAFFLLGNRFHTRLFRHVAQDKLSYKARCQAPVLTLAIIRHRGTTMSSQTDLGRTEILQTSKFSAMKLRILLKSPPSGLRSKSAVDSARPGCCIRLQNN